MLRLGLAQVVNLAVMCAQREQFRSDDALVAGYIDRLWRHAVASAFGSRWIAERCGWRELASEAFMAGLFHDIGVLLLLKVIEQIRAASGSQHVPEQLVMEVIDALHAEQGGRLIEAWRLPEAYARVARSHHAPEIDSAGTLGVIVRLADRACHKLGFALDPQTGVVLSACAEAGLLGMTEIALAELEIYLEDTVEDTVEDTAPLTV
jgi:HD-like signal output (HDOD) protein